MKMKMLKLNCNLQISHSFRPHGQGVICFVKAAHICLLFDCIQSSVGADPNLNTMQGWKSCTTTDVVTFIKAAVDELKPEPVYAS